ncbi:MAG: ankyrin repeat domain-containing protein [Planctomycetota bacterium]
MSKSFFTACDRGNIAKLTAMLEDGVDPNSRDNYQLTGLIRASRKGQLDAIALLLESGADVDLDDVCGRTALFHAVCFNHIEAVAQLIELGASVNPVDSHGWTPLDMARSQRSDEIEILLERHDGIANNYEKVDVPDRFTIGAQFGGPDVGHIAELKRELCSSLNEHCLTIGCESVDEIGLVLRVNGPICSFGEQGVERVRHSAKQRYVTADIVISGDATSLSRSKTQSLLAGLIELAIEQCIIRLRKKKLSFAPNLENQVKNAIAEFSRGAP